jgi:tripartite-type tricarboxylate transporter receptor subunit TctC
MPGATSLIMTNYVYNSAPRDGTVIGMPNSNVPLEPRLKLLSRDGGNVKFDLGRVNWLGTPTQEPQVLWVWHDVADRIEDLKTHKIQVGSTGAGADNYTLPIFTRRLLGADISIVTGYIGQNEINLAVERGEIQGNSTSISNLTVGKADWMRDKKVHILLQYGSKRLASLADVPTAMELAGKDIDREMLRFYALKFALARPLMLPPNVPEERVKALQQAFDETMADPLFLAEAAKLGLDIDPLRGPQIAGMIDEIDKTPQEVVDRVRQLLDEGTK